MGHWARFGRYFGPRCFLGIIRNPKHFAWGFFTNGGETFLATSASASVRATERTSMGTTGRMASPHGTAG